MTKAKRVGVIILHILALPSKSECGNQFYSLKECITIIMIGHKKNIEQKKLAKCMVIKNSTKLSLIFRGFFFLSNSLFINSRFASNEKFQQDTSKFILFYVYRKNPFFSFHALLYIFMLC